MTGWPIFAAVLIVLGVAGTVWALLRARTVIRPADPDRPGADDQFGTWPALRAPAPASAHDTALRRRAAVLGVLRQTDLPHQERVRVARDLLAAIDLADTPERTRT